MQVLVDIHMEALHYAEQDRRRHLSTLSLLLSRLATFVHRIDVVLEVPLPFSRKTVGTRLWKRMYIKKMTPKACCTVVLLVSTAWLGTLDLCLRLA